MFKAMSIFAFVFLLSTTLLCSSKHLKQKGSFMNTKSRSVSLNFINNDMIFNHLLPAITKFRKPMVTCLVAVSLCLPQSVSVNEAVAVGGSMQQGMNLFRKGDVKGNPKRGLKFK
jgi:hypothetical protein